MVGLLLCLENHKPKTPPPATPSCPASSPLPGDAPPLAPPLGPESTATRTAGRTDSAGTHTSGTHTDAHASGRTDSGSGTHSGTRAAGRPRGRGRRRAEGRGRGAAETHQPEVGETPHLSEGEENGEPSTTLPSVATVMGVGRRTSVLFKKAKNGARQKKAEPEDLVNGGGDKKEQTERNPDGTEHTQNHPEPAAKAEPPTGPVPSSPRHLRSRRPSGSSDPESQSTHTPAPTAAPHTPTLDTHQHTPTKDSGERNLSTSILVSLTTFSYTSVS